jgi:UDP-N-acetylglucosamine pyrophosphorylase
MAPPLSTDDTRSVLTDLRLQARKLKMFVFDRLPYTERFGVLEVANEDEFSPLKYTPGTGADDRETRHRDLLKARSGTRLLLPPVTCIPAIKKWLVLTATYRRRRPSGL